MADKTGGSKQTPSSEVIRHIKQFYCMHLKEIGDLLRDTVTAWVDDKSPRLGASLAFYTALSLAPLLVVVLAVAGLAYGKQAAEGQLVWQIRDLVGVEGAKAIESVIKGAQTPSTSAIATILGLLTLFFGASSVVVELKDALNTIWHVPVDPGSTGIAGMFRLLKQRFYSFAMILGVGFLLLVSLVVNAWFAAMGRFFQAALPFPEYALHILSFLISFLVITVLFAMIYKIFPDVHLEWSDVIIGAGVTSLLFTLGKVLLGVYLGKSNIGSAYGAAGSMVIVLVWVYYSSQVFFMGAEFTKVYTMQFGSMFSATLQPTPPKPESVIIDPSTNAPFQSAQDKAASATKPELV